MQNFCPTLDNCKIVVVPVVLFLFAAGYMKWRMGPFAQMIAVFMLFRILSGALCEWMKQTWRHWPDYWDKARTDIEEEYMERWGRKEALNG